MQPQPLSKSKSIEQRFNEYDGKRGTLLRNCEQYAAWTLPYLFPKEHNQPDNQEILNPPETIGARGVNHLANKVVTAMFRPQGPFFRLRLDAATRRKVKAAKGSNADKVFAQLESDFADLEKEAIEHLDMVEFRPIATLAAKYLIVTGNALMFHPPKGAPQVYSLRDYVIIRDLSGEVIELITRESKAFETFHPDVQQQIRSLRADKKEIAATDDITVYTQVILEDDGRYHAKQEAGGVALKLADAAWPRHLLPWIPLVWNRIRGANYGHGLVSEYAKAFHSINVLEDALLAIAGVVSDIKFLVNPASHLDVVELNNSPPGSYHPGKEGDVTQITLDKYNDLQFLQNQIDRYERRLGEVFMLNSAVTRDAERVTAEEIRRQAYELETSFGGMYSQQAMQWQVPTANILLYQIGFDSRLNGIEPQIITGMDSLSRQGEMENIHMWLADLALLEQLPEDVRARISIERYGEFTGAARQVNYKQIMKTEDELKADQARALEANGALAQQQAAAAVAQEAGKQAIKGE
ncbi:portal protein [Pannonibacter sp. SL95]|uniref:portal protein n=1 Tax=Pannonibacter sp. SL95 TaxID=2995153 RepID=UPI002276AD60|nr:portal protein [Pannonibacter sp. SL95]MCY1708363.1 portal protein [Pannonibacter sp. SL95]